MSGTRDSRPAIHAASPLWATLREALRSACATTPHDLHRNRACEARFRLSVYLHSEHCRLVYAGSTYTSGTPAQRALYVRNCPSWANAQECTAARWGLLNRALARIPWRSSRATPREVRSASATMLFETQWFTSAANRRSRRARFLRQRLAPLVPLFSNPAPRRTCR